MANDMCTRRLTRELQSLQKNPLVNPRIVAIPHESNILEWHYVIEGSKGTPYEGGHFHGKLIFPKEYPLKPPSVIMLTPSGRFKPNRRLCLKTAPTLGSIETSDAQKRKLARQSLDFNVRDTNFRSLFPDYVELHKKRIEERKRQLGPEAAGRLGSQITSPGGQRGGVGIGGADGQEEAQGLLAAAAGVVALLSILFAMRVIS